MKNLCIICMLFIFTPLLPAAQMNPPKNIEALAKELNLYGGQKATIQWERVFSSPRHLKRYKLEKLPISTRLALKKYLIEHAADSEQPIIPGL